MVRGSGRIGLAALALALAAVAPAQAADDDARYELVHGCYALKSAKTGKFVAKSDGGYTASAGAPGAAEGFRMQATDLGRYLLYGKAQDFLAAAGGAVEVASAPSDDADWRVDVAGSGLTLSVSSSGRTLAVGDGGKLVTTDPGSGGDAATFTFEKAGGCAVYPEIDTSTTGEPARNAVPFGEVRGYLDAHLHLMAFEFLGGSVHCGRPWHKFGVAYAMVDCPDHAGNGHGAALEKVLYKDPTYTHDPTGWPTFKDWPHWKSLTHEGTYWKWMERSWRGGQRMFVNLLVDNGVLCELYPLKRNSCNEMETVGLELRATYALQDYIDAQYGGPGKGFFRIVKSPAQARRVINQGKLAVVLGIENSRLFNCGVYNDKPECTTKDIDRELDHWYAQGVRGMELINKFDNALSGVAGDGGDTGLIVNSGNKYETGKFWQMDTCEEGKGHDKPQHALPGLERDALAGAIIRLYMPPGTAPLYPEEPHCNRMGLSPLGEHLIRGMMKRGMLMDPDHMSQVGRDQALALIEAEDYSGVVSSHSWSNDVDYPRIYRAGGVVTPYAGSSTGFAQEWRKIREMRDKRFFFGFGYGADMNGFGAQGPPREGAEKNPVTYPFKSFDGKVTLHQHKSGERVWDINKDGVSHYGLYPDWIEDLRKIAGDQIVEDMSKGAEAYLQTWERATGIPGPGCRSSRGKLTTRGFGRLRLGSSHARVLRRAGQPRTRDGRVWSWCVHGKRNRRAEVVAVFTKRGRLALVATNARGPRALGVERGERAPSEAESFGAGVRAVRAGRSLVAFGVDDGRVEYLAAATGEAAKSPRRLRGYLKLAGLR